MTRLHGPFPELGLAHFHSFEAPLPEWPAFTHINEAICTASHVLRPHAHPHVEICFFYAGHAEWRTGGESFRLRPGDFYISRPGELHSGLPDPRDPNHNFAVGFDPSQLPLSGTAAALPAPPSSEVASALDETCAVAASAPPSFRRVIPGGQGSEIAYRRILGELDHLDASDPVQRGLTRLMVQTLLVELLVSVTRLSIAHLERSHPPPSTSRPPRSAVAALLAWLPSQVAAPPSLSAMASRVGLSPTHFAVAFKREVGKTPLEYMTGLRIDEAARRLRGGASVTEVAMTLGFSSSQYFSMVFKKHYGCTPSEWRR